MYISHLLYPFFSWLDRLFSPFGYCKQCFYEHRCANICLNSCFNSFGYISRSGISGSYGHSMFSFLRNYHTVFHSVCTILYSHNNAIVFQYLHDLTNMRSFLLFSLLSLSVCLGRGWWLGRASVLPLFSAGASWRRTTLFFLRTECLWLCSPVASQLTQKCGDVRLVAADPIVRGNISVSFWDQ